MYVFVPVLKIRSHAAVWSCHVFVLKFLCSSTGVTIIMPNVLIIYKRKKPDHRAEEKYKGLGSNPIIVTPAENL